MATLTYDPTPADQHEFNEQERESLAVGEQAEAEQQQLLAGKFKDPEALEQAYLELQSKLGQPRDEVQTTDQGQQETAPEENVAEEPNQNLTVQDANELMASAGGAEQYQQMMLWAAENLSRQEIDMYDSVVAQGDKNACFFAINALLNRYTDAVGVEGKLLSGRGTSDTYDVFRSQAEVVQAMQDPRYDKDPAFRQDVFNKLERSNLSY